MRRVYYLQIADELGRVAMFEAGGRLEADFVQAVTAELAKTPVGLLTSTPVVLERVAQAVERAIDNLKQQSRYTSLVSGDRS